MITMSNLGDTGSPDGMPKELSELKAIIDPWMLKCSEFVHSVDSMCKHMEQAAEIYDLRDLVSLMSDQYRDIALRAAIETFTEDTDIAGLKAIALRRRAIVRELDQLADTTVMWPVSWPRWLVKHYLRVSVIDPCMGLYDSWRDTLAKLRKFNMPDWLHSNVYELVTDPIPMIKDMLARDATPDPDIAKCYRECCNAWLNMVKEGVSEYKAGIYAFRWFKERKVGSIASMPQDTADSTLDALIGEIPPDMPMDGWAK